MCGHEKSRFEAHRDHNSIRFKLQWFFEMNKFDLEAKLFFQTYKRLAVEVECGEGMYLMSKSGERYLDMFAGLGVNALGYNNPKIKQAIERQIGRYIHLSNLFVMDSQLEFTERLLKYSGYDKAFLTNSGTEATEGAIKLVRKWGNPKGKTDILALTNSFHGRSMGSLSLTERPKYRDGYEPFLPNVYHVEFNNTENLRKKVNEKTSALFLEFIQGEGGINVISREFVDELFVLREKHDFLIVADEIQSGAGRTGEFFAYEHYGVKPDVALVAKPLGGGLPVGAILGNRKVADVFAFGAHGTTFGGNPVACAAGIVVLDEIMENGLMENAGVVGAYLKQKLLELKQEFSDLIADVRGLGLMLGIELTQDGSPFVLKALENHMLINCTNNVVLRFLPPFIITHREADSLLEVLRKIFKDRVAGS